MAENPNDKTGQHDQPHQPLSLPPPVADSAAELELGGVVRLDELGPMVVNSDGTLSRIANWQTMTELERERTVRVLSKRNQLRLSNEERKLQESGAGEGEQKLSLTALAGEVQPETES